jgi:hypothetical protein
LIELSSSPGWSIFTLLPFFSCTLTAHPSCRAKPPPPSFPSLARVVLPFSLFCHLATANSASTSTSTPSSPFPLLRYLVFLHEDKARRYFIRSPLGPSLSSRCRRSFRRTALQGSRRGCRCPFSTEQAAKRRRLQATLAPLHLLHPRLHPAPSPSPAHLNSSLLLPLRTQLPSPKRPGASRP